VATQVQKQPLSTEIADLRRLRRESFLGGLGWKHLPLQPMQADASFRRYYRLQGASRPLLLMEDPPDRPPVPPFVMVEPFTRIAEHLRNLGLQAPEVHFSDIPNGLLLIDDFGDDTYTRLFDRGLEPKPLYELAVDALVHLHRHPERGGIELPKYDDKHLTDEAMLLLDWYYPALSGKKPSEEMKQSFAAVWKELFRQFPQDQQTLVLRDYHVDNLMLIPGMTGLQSCGLLDFQDAVIGPFSYDLMSLLEDARRDVPQELQQHLYNRYMQGMGAKLDRAGFDYSYRVLAAQRHAKVLGIFVRLSVRDGKDRYLKFVPHVHKLFLNALDTPTLTPLRDWFKKNDIDIRSPLK
jgi:aminoglycoside/choline kinase family phosphotransferase